MLLLGTFVGGSLLVEAQLTDGFAGRCCQPRQVAPVRDFMQKKVARVSDNVFIWNEPQKFLYVFQSSLW